MSGANESPWVARITKLLDRGVITKRAELRPAPLGDLRALSPEAASIQLDCALKRLYVPTAQEVDLMWVWLEQARAHFVSNYPSLAAYRGRIHMLPSQESQACAEVPPFCLTGLPGTGKSELVRAHLRVIGPPTTIDAGPGVGQVPMVGALAFAVGPNLVPTKLLEHITGDRCKCTADALLLARRRLYRQGVGLIMPDEFQFANGSSGANTRIAQSLLTVSLIGIPSTYSCNFSLLHRLRSRPPEDLQRILNRCVTHQPLLPESDDWRAYLRALRDIAPKVLEFDLDADAILIHRRTGGIRRAVRRLLCIACAIAWRNRTRATGKEIELAYLDPEFACYRSQIDALERIAAGDQRARTANPGLWNPLESDADAATSAYLARLRKQREERVEQQALKDAATADERKAMRAIENGTSPKFKLAKPGDARPRKRARQVRCADTLQSNFSKVKRSL